MTVDFTIVLVMMNFILLMIILNKILYKPLKKYLQERQVQIKNDIEEAHSSIEKAEQLALQRDQELKQSMDEARKLKDSIVVEAEKKAEKILETAKEKEKDIIAQSDEKIQIQKKTAFKEIEKEVAQLVSSLSARLIAEKMDAESDKKLIEKLLSERS